MSAPQFGSLAMLVEASARSSGDVIWILATITHDDMSDALRLVMGSHEPVESNGETFLPARFDVTLSSQDPDRTPEVNFTLDDVSQVMLEALQELDPGPIVTLQLVLASAPDNIVHQETDLQLAGLDGAGLTSLQALMIGDPIESQPYPGKNMDRDLAPALYSDSLDGE